MAYFRVCPHCGGHLDPEEPCDCQEEEEKNRKIWEQNTMPGKRGQISFRLEIDYGRTEKVG